MTLFSDKNNNMTIVSPDASDIISSRMHYLHPEYVDEKSKSIYSQSRCPLSMLAETCKNIGKPAIENSQLFQSQESSISISPSCSSSCSAPKFSPHSLEYSPVEQSKLMEEGTKDRSVKEKPKKRKSLKKESEIPHKQIQLDHHALHSNYAIAEFLKMNNISRDSFVKPEPNTPINPIYNHLMNQNLTNQFNHSSIWKSKPTQNPRASFPMNYLQHAYPPPNIPLQNGLYRCPPSMLYDINQFYNHCPIEKPTCDCLACNNRKNAIDKNLMKIEPLLSNFFQGLRKERPPNNTNHMNMSILSLLQNSNSSPGATAIKYCMYCGQCIPLIQNLLNHIHTEHIDSINTNLCPKVDSAGPFSSNFNVDNLQSNEMNINEINALKNLELLKHLQFIYNHDNQTDNCSDKSVLMK